MLRPDSGQLLLSLSFDSNLLPLNVVGSRSLNAATHSMNFFALRFSNKPIRGDRRASLASDGTFATVALELAPTCT